MLASRLGIATLVLIGLGAYIAIRPFGSLGMPEPKAEAATTAEQDFKKLLEELANASPADHVQGPEGEQTFVLKRQPDGSITVTRGGVETETQTPSQQDQEDELEGLRQDLDRARDGAVAALADYEQAQNALINAERNSGSEPVVTERQPIQPPVETTTPSEFDRTLDEIELALLEVDAQKDAEPQKVASGEEAGMADPASASLFVDVDKMRQLQGRAKGTASDVPDEDLAGKNLMGRDFSNQNLAGINLRRAVLTGANFNGANLTGADFRGAKLQGATFVATNLIDADLTGVSAQAARFPGADLRRATLENANFTGTDLTDADLRGAATEKLILNGAVRIGTLFDGVLGASTRSKFHDPSPPIE